MASPGPGMEGLDPFTAADSFVALLFGRHIVSRSVIEFRTDVGQNPSRHVRSSRKASRMKSIVSKCLSSKYMECI